MHGSSKMNAHCEQFNRTLQDELVDDTLYNLEDADKFNDKMSDYLFWYNAKRPHDILGQISPIEYLKMNEETYRGSAMCYGHKHDTLIISVYNLLRLN